MTASTIAQCELTVTVVAVAHTSAGERIGSSFATPAIAELPGYRGAMLLQAALNGKWERSRRAGLPVSVHALIDDAIECYRGR